ncbi:MAG: glycosyltransferase [Candidatus Baltobacteraceae bacterium]
MNPLVTIVITSYNYGSCIGDAIRSALDQTYKHIEVLVLDNASTDNSVEVVRSFTDARIRLVTRPETIGIQRNHNDGIKEAKGDFIVFLSADDMLLPTLVEDVLDYRAKHPDIDIVYASAIIMDGEKHFSGYFDQPSFDGAETYYGRHEFASLLTRDSAMYLPTILFPRHVFEELGPMNETLEIVLDYEYGIRMASAGKRFAFISRPGALIRFHGENRSGVKNFVKTGKQIREFCSLLTWYTEPKYHQQLAGWRRELEAMVENKIREFQTPFPQEFALQQGELQPLIDTARASIAAVPAIGDAVLRGEGVISVVMPFSGRIGPFQRSLLSLQAQNYDRWEAVVVADSTFDPSDVIAHMGMSEKVRVSSLRSRHGINHARNLGIGGATGEIVAYLDEGNCFAPEHLTTLAAAFARPSTQVTIASSRLVITSAKDEALVAVPIASGTRAAPVSRVSNRLPLNAVAHRRSCLSAAGGSFNRQLGVLDDWEFLLRLSAGFAFTPVESTVDTCVRVVPLDHPVFGRRDTRGWTEFGSLVNDIHKAYPAHDAAEAAAQAQYAAGLQAIINRGVAGYGSPDEIAEFALGVLGMTPATVATA